MAAASTLKNRVISWLPAGTFISNELIRSYIRPIYGRRQYGLLSTVLGWLPNLLAAFGMLAMAVLIVWLLQAKGANSYTASRKKLILLAVSTLVIAGLLWHEFGQGHAGLFYDINDVYATLAGTAVGAAFYYYALLYPSPGLPPLPVGERPAGS